MMRTILLLVFLAMPSYAVSQTLPATDSPSWAVRVIEFVERYDKFVNLSATGAVAIFTVVLAVSTIGLWRQTARAARAAELSAKAAIGIELPVLRPIKPELVSMQDPAWRGGGGITEGVPDQYSRFIVCFENHGRTPAFPTQVSLGWALIKKLPSTPNFRVMTPIAPGTTIKAEGTWRPEFEHHCIEVSDPELALIRSREADLWLYGSVKYRDFIEQEHELRFCFRWTPEWEDKPARFQFFRDVSTPPAYTLRS